MTNIIVHNGIKTIITEYTTIQDFLDVFGVNVDPKRYQKWLRKQQGIPEPIVS